MSSTIGSTKIERLLVIDRALRRLAVPSFPAIIDELHSARLPASKRTVQRDFKYLQQEYGAPQIEPFRCNPDENDGRIEYGYRYEDPTWELKVDAITETDLDAIKLARHVLQTWEGHPSADDLKVTFDKLLDQADVEVQKHVKSGLDSIAFAPVTQQRIKPEVWRNILEAAKRRKSIRMEYDKRQAWNKKGQKSRLVDPYYVVNLGGVWYLLGTAGLNDASIRQYDMSRILSAKICATSFKVPKSFDIEKILQNTFGRFIGDPNDLVEVKVRFTPKVCPLVETQSFHPREKRRKDKQGRITVSFPVTPTGVTPELRFYHVRSWILSWGPDCEVLAPTDLQDLVRGDIAEMMTRTNA
jgi:predicted DNA-binding transcriptional regulator YafY